MIDNLPDIPIDNGGQDCYIAHKPAVEDIWHSFYNRGFDLADSLCVLTKLVLLIAIQGDIEPKAIIDKMASLLTLKMGENGMAYDRELL